MEIVYGTEKQVKQSKFTVVTLGVFDGAHKGHMEVLNKTVNWARENGGQSVVLTFNRSPKVILGKRPSSIITSLEHRLGIFKRLGVDVTVVMEFNDKFANVEANDFIKDIIHNWLGAKAFVLGCNCSFGKDRKGDKTLVMSLAKQYGYEVYSCKPVELEGNVVSSTLIRESILNGNLDRAAKMLGRPVSGLGTVVTGSGRGSKVLFPTANIDLHHEVLPPRGVYGTFVFLNGKKYLALTNIGARPTFEDVPFADDSNLETVVEAHILDFNGSIYGQDLEVQFLFKIRDEKKFGGVEELKEQIERDKSLFLEQAKKFKPDPSLFSAEKLAS